jgi:rhodanese-related sulfurtransferase
MTFLNDLLRLARERAERLNLAYAGALTPAEAYEVWQGVPGARLLDIRTRAELELVGHIPGASHIEWQFYPGGEENPHFMRQLRAQIDREALLIIICRSGVRSDLAAIAATQAGYTACYNVLEGFEGDKDVNGQRGKIGGWRLADLPWTNE